MNGHCGLGHSDPSRTWGGAVRAGPVGLSGAGLRCNGPTEAARRLDATVGLLAGNLMCRCRRSWMRVTSRSSTQYAGNSDFPLPITKRRRLSRVANIKSQIKRIKTNEKARQRNAAVRSSLKTSVRKFRSAADAGDAGTANAELLKASRQLDKAASKGVIHKNQAANRKSAMAKKAASL